MSPIDSTDDGVVSDPTTKPLLEFENISAYRGLSLALEDITFSIAKGQSTVILGPNGAGKSTLLKLMTRELYPASDDIGMLRIFGEERWNIWDLRPRLGIVSLDVQHQYNGFVCGEDVILSGIHSTIGHVQRSELSDVELQRGREIAEELGISGLLEKPFHSMSTGEQRRCIMGRALINRPELMILDEPTSGMDPGGTFESLDRSAQLINDGTTILLVTHYVHEIMPAINRVILLKEGRIMAMGDKQDVLTDANLSKLFGVKVRVNCDRGYYFAVPG